MDSVTDVMQVGSSVSGRKKRNRLFTAGYLAAIAAAMIGWVSAIGWIAVKTLG